MASWSKVLTARDSGERLAFQGQIASVSSELAPSAIKLDPEQQFQTILGFGGAFTEAAAYTLSRINPEKRDEVIRSYFDPK